MKLQDLDINTLWGTLIVEECIRNHINYFCVSPGSRSTPLTLAIAQHPKATNIICFDERGAAFHGLGYARATGKPAILVCTSGTAAANYLPAIIEAKQENIPLLILSSDRPPELRDSGANQTISQPNLFQEYTRWKFDFPCPTEQISWQVVLTTINQAIYQTRKSPAGPVHLNCMFREPLEPSSAPVSSSYLNKISYWENKTLPFTQYETTSIIPQDFSQIATILNQPEKGLVLIGRLENQAEKMAVLKLIDFLKWPAFPDITSGLRLGNQSNYLIPYFDQILLNKETSNQPKKILHLGGQLVSKRVLQFLQKTFLEHYLVVKNHPFRYDPTHQVTYHLETNLPLFVNTLLPKLQRAQSSQSTDHWKKKSEQVEIIIKDFLTKKPLNDITVAHQISTNLPQNSALFLGNSMPIRDMDMYASPRGESVAVAANRGASGIDGNLATATGFAMGHQSMVTLILGDLTLIHDLSSLTLLKNLSQKLILILLNNYGGGIFSFLPIAQFPQVFESYFGTPHDFTFEKVAQNFNLNYHQPTTEKALLEAYQQAIKSPKSTLIEVQTNREENHKIHQQLQQEIQTALLKIT